MTVAVHVSGRASIDKRSCFKTFLQRRCYVRTDRFPSSSSSKKTDSGCLFFFHLADVTSPACLAMPCDADERAGPVLARISSLSFLPASEYVELFSDIACGKKASSLLKWVRHDISNDGDLKNHMILSYPIVERPGTAIQRMTFGEVTFYLIIH